MKKRYFYQGIYKFLFLGLIVFILTSCCHENTYKVVDNNYVPLYKKGDTLVFKSSIGTYDTIFVVSVEKHDDKLDNMDNCGTAEHREVLICVFDSLPKYSGSYANSVSIDYQNEIFISFKESGFNSKIKYAYTVISEVVVENHFYQNVYNFSDISSSKNKRTLLYDLKYGIIQYSDSSSVWNLIRKQ